MSRVSRSRLEQRRLQQHREAQRRRRGQEHPWEFGAPQACKLCDGTGVVVLGGRSFACAFCAENVR